MITIADMEFENGTVTIVEGTTVTWVWDDAPMEHNVVFDDFESPLQAEGTFAHVRGGWGIRLPLRPTPVHEGHDHRRRGGWSLSRRSPGRIT